MTEAERTLCIRTVLALTHYDTQRRAFIAGYNGSPRPKRSSVQMRDNYDLGIAVRKVLQEQADD